MAVMDEDGLQHVHLEMEAKNVALFGLDRFTSYIPYISSPIWVLDETYVNSRDRGRGWLAGSAATQTL